jgi:predicted PurR-regulated permease PerM
VVIGLVYVAISGVTGAGTGMLLPTESRQVVEAASQAPGDARPLGAWQMGWSQSYERLTLPAEVRRRIDQSLLDAGDRVVAHVRESVLAGAGILSYLPWLVLIPVLAFFLLKDAESLREAALNARPQRFRGRGYRLFEELTRRSPPTSVRSCWRACWSARRVGWGSRRSVCRMPPCSASSRACWSSFPWSARS